MRLAALGLLFVACGTPTVHDGKSYAAISTSDKVINEADRCAAIAACGERIAIGCAAGVCEL